MVTKSTVFRDVQVNLHICIIISNFFHFRVFYTLEKSLCCLGDLRHDDLVTFLRAIGEHIQKQFIAAEVSSHPGWPKLDASRYGIGFLLSSFFNFLVCTTAFHSATAFGQNHPLICLPLTLSQDQAKQELVL